MHAMPTTLVSKSRLCNRGRAVSVLMREATWVLGSMVRLILPPTVGYNKTPLPALAYSPSEFRRTFRQFQEQVRMRSHSNLLTSLKKLRLVAECSTVRAQQQLHLRPQSKSVCFKRVAYRLSRPGGGHTWNIAENAKHSTIQMNSCP